MIETLGDFDYRVFGECEFGVPDFTTEDQVSSCGEAAVAEVWWGDIENGSKMVVCPEHFRVIENTEAKVQLR